MPDELVERVDAVAERMGGSGSRMISELMAYFDNAAEDRKREDAERRRTREQLAGGGGVEYQPE